MRVVKWIFGIAAGLMLLAAGLVLFVTSFVDPNRFKGRIEAAVRDATGLPFKINGDLDIAWYPWLAVRTGPAQLGAERPLVQWQAVRVGARLIPLIQGRLVVSRLRLEGLQAHLRRSADGHANWESLLNRRRANSARLSARAAEIGGVEITEGAFEYVDERDGTRLSVADWALDAEEWRPGRPFSVSTRFVLQNGAPSSVRIPIALHAPKIQMQSTPVSVSIPAFELQLADARLEGSLALKSLTPMRAGGALSVKSASLRKLLADLGFGGPRPRDATTLGAFKLTSRWVAHDGAVAVKPLEIQIDQTKLGGELVRSREPQPVWSFNLRGDRIALERYTDIEKTDDEPFELPTAALQALRVQGVLSFDEAQFANARLKNVRLRLEPRDIEPHAP